MTDNMILFVDDIRPESYLSTDNRLSFYSMGHLIGRVIGLTAEDVKAIDALKEDSE